jgi:hypothetical protein
MSERNLLEGRTGPITQSIDAVKALLTWKGRSTKPLPQFVEMGQEDSKVVLMLSNKKDSYYTKTATKCSCPAASYHHGPCKHQREYFAEVKVATKPNASEPLIKRGGFKPFDELSGERAAKAASISAIDLSNHSIREDKIMWPVEA